MTEFDSLFRSLWLGECPPEAFIDWILTKVEDSCPFRFETHYKYISDEEWFKTEEYRGAHDAICHFWVERLRGDSLVIQVGLNCVDLGIGDNRNILPGKFPYMFSEWFSEQMDLLYYILSK